MIRSILCFTACLNANANDAIVFPPPVGTVKRKSPFSFSPASRHALKISVLLPFTLSVSLFSSHPAICCSSFSKSCDILSPCCRPVFPFVINFSVSRKSASTKQEYNIRINILKENSAFLVLFISMGAVFNSGI